MFTLEVHVTHICQPLDNGPFSIFKQTLKRLKRGLKEFKGVARRKKILLAAKEALYVMVYPEKIRSSWRKVGIHPFNKELALEDDSVMKQKEAEPKVGRSGRLKITRTMIFNQELIGAIEERNWKKKEKEVSKGTKKDCVVKS